MNNGDPSTLMQAAAAGSSNSAAGHGASASRTDDFREDVRFRILRVLELHPEYSQREIANSLGVSLGGVNYCLRALVEKGHVKVANFRRSETKLRYAYVLTPSGVAEKAVLTSRFLQRKIKEYEALKAEIDALTEGAASASGPNAAQTSAAGTRATDVE